MQRKRFLVVILSRLEKAMLLSPDGFFIICEKQHNFKFYIKYWRIGSGFEEFLTCCIIEEEINMHMRLTFSFE